MSSASPAWLTLGRALPIRKEETMGLDMFLYAEEFASENYFKPETYKTLTKEVPFATTGSLMLKVEVAYWRKVNAVHQWFVDNVQDGEDDCHEYGVPREKLQELLDICKLIELDNASASELLPPASGFFFGTYEYDEWYFEGIKQTIEQVERVLKEVPADWNITYQSSW
jgi:hypothetical protein